MDRRTDIVNSHLAPDVLDLRDWDLDPKVGLDDPLDLSARSTSSEAAETMAFFEALPMATGDPMISPIETMIEAEVAPATSRLRRVALILLAVAATGFVVWAVAVQLGIGQ